MYLSGKSLQKFDGCYFFLGFACLTIFFAADIDTPTFLANFLECATACMNRSCFLLANGMAIS